MNIGIIWNVLEDHYFDDFINDYYDDANIYNDAIIFEKMRTKNQFVFKQESNNDTFKVKLCHCPR